ncbi:MAG: hypothetical protein KDE27_26775 [Planctomycetes bacterium]|nr:hypothetical protein [Planctomycetota bacterium]
MSRRRAFVGLALLLVAGCEGGGSDIGPRLSPLPSDSSKVNVYDDDNRGVTAARVTIDGTNVAALTGRNGRGDLFANPTGQRVVRVDGSFAAARSGDLLGVVAAALSLPGGDVPAVFHLPDAATGGSATIPVGTQAGAAVLPNPAANGGSTMIPIGASVGMASGAAQVTLRLGTLQAQHGPAVPPAGVLLGRGLYVDPLDVTIAPGADFAVTDDLAAAGTVTLWHLDDATGEWATAGIGNAAGGLISAAAGITTGGLWAFGVAVSTGSVRGRVVDVDDVPVRDALVVVDGRRGRTGADGVFVVTDVPATTADGAPRSASIEVFAGGSWLPAIATAAAAMIGTAEVDAGDIELDTLPAGNLRVQQVKRARSEPFRLARMSSLFGGVAVATISDGAGQAIFEDVPSRWFGFQDAFPRDRVAAIYSQSVGFTGNGQRWRDAFQFYDEAAWFTGSRSSRVIVTDALGTGPIYDAAFVRGSTPDAGFVGVTREGGVLFSERSMSGRATATVRTERAGRAITHTLSIDTPNGEKLEMPLQQALRPTLGAFDRHGLYAGTVTGADPGAMHRLRATRRIELQEWWDDVVEGIAIPSALPIDVDPATTHAAYRAGVDRVGGHLAVAELSTTGGVRLEKLAVATDLQPPEGALTALDLPLDHVANAVFAAPGALAELDARLTGSLSASLALRQPSGLAIDVVRDLTGNLAVSGGDLALTLPPLAGSIAGNDWLALVGGSTAVGTDEIAQRALLRFGAGGVIGAPKILPLPTISEPVEGATVLSAGFTVQFTLPPGTLYGVLELRNESASELLLWQAYVPPTATSFTFVTFPMEAVSPLVSGRSYELRLSAYGSSNGGGVLATSNNAYRDRTTYLQSISPVEIDVDAVSTYSRRVTSL